MKLNNKLYVIPTPIGNIDDITIRAIKILENIDVLFCEDTRETIKLLKNLNIGQKTLVSSHEHNESFVKKEVIKHLKDGKSVGIVSDRGTPVISDPGYVVVKEVVENNFEVEVLPGATAFTPALVASSIEPTPFLFYGFLNNKTNKRKNELEKLKQHPFTLIFYESPNRIHKTIQDIFEVLGNRNISISREISKLYEETYRFNEQTVNYEQIKEKGEFVIVVSGNYDDPYGNIDVFDHIDLYLKQGYTQTDAIKKVSKIRNINKSSIYNEYMKRK